MAPRTLTACIALLGYTVATQAQTDSDSFDWSSITPTRDLRYHDCFKNLKCARLEVPMDWRNPDDNRTVAIAITTVPASVPIDHPDHGGTILVNPGGPGGSGVSLAKGRGANLQRVVDATKKYEILGFDPRGIGETTPRIDCFGDRFARDAYELVQRGLGLPDAGENALRRRLALYEAFGSLCEKTFAKSGILEHVSTAVVSRDMVEIVDRLDELRKAELAKLQHGVISPHGEQRPIGGVEPVGSGDIPRLQYIGFSYGTVLGNTFASMFPGRVGRVVIDGVVDIDDYMTGSWAKNLLDADKVVDYFYERCFQAGKKCSIWTSDDKSSDDIKKRVNKFIADADASPIPFVEGNNVHLVTGTEINEAFFLAVYRPTALYPKLAEMLTDAMVHRNFSQILNQNGIPRIKDHCPAANATEDQLKGDAQAAILGTDADNQEEHGIKYWLNLIASNKRLSPSIGAAWSTIPMLGFSIQSRPKWRFSGPWTTPPADASLKEGVPAAPLLLLTSVLDPVTPAVNANLMSAGHPGSAVVIQNSVGHCALGTAWSDCTADILRNFFEHGIVPKNGTVCEPRCGPWDEDCQGIWAAALGETNNGDELAGFSRRFPLGI